MNKTLQLVLTTGIFLFIHSFSYTQADSLVLKRAFSTLEDAKTCFRQHPRGPVCNALLREAYELSGKHAYFLEEIVAYLIENENYAQARDYVDVKRTDTLSNSLKARHFHFKGLLELKSGFYYFTRAYQSFYKAYHFELRSVVPSFKLLSQIQNAMGYTRLIYGGPNLSGEEDYPHCNWVTSDLVSALKHFEQALYFDGENQNALANRDTLVAKIVQSGSWVDEIAELTRPKTIELIRSELLIDQKSTNDTLDLLNVNLLPNNKQLILRILEKYDELLVVVDISGSMEDIHLTKGVSRFILMKELVLFLFHELSASTRAGIVSVGGQCNRHPRLYFPTEMDARKDIMDQMKTLGPDGNTPLIYSLKRGKELYTTEENKKALFLISDGMERCGPPMDLCILAGDLHAMGIDLHIISFIVEGMEDSEFAYEIYNCMTRYSEGYVFRYDEDIVVEEPPVLEPSHEEILLLPPITFGNNLKGILHFEVNLADYFGQGSGVHLAESRE